MYFSTCFILILMLFILCLLLGNSCNLFRRGGFMNLKQIGIKVRKRRKELHITIEKLAELANISVSSVSLLERGKLSDIHFNNLCNIAEALDVDLFYLISNDDNTILELRKLNKTISKYSKEKQHDIIQAILCLLNTK